jgi:RNA recognition motif-containing protein
LTCFSCLQIFVGALDPSVTDDTLRAVFSKYGELVHVKIPAGKRCGFVQFANRYMNTLISVILDCNDCLVLIWLSVFCCI